MCEKTCEGCKYYNKSEAEFPCVLCCNNYAIEDAFRIGLIYRYQPMTPESETVNHPKHYQGKHECIDEMIALFGKYSVMEFCRCNIYKYKFRAEKKGGAEDLAKAEWYMDKLMELMKED